MGELTQKRADEIFRDINIIVNGFYTMNRLAYWSLRLGGFVAWNGHRKRNSKIPGTKIMAEELKEDKLVVPADKADSK